MPELPEVETIKNDLASKIKGKYISDIAVLWPGILNIGQKDFIKKVKGAKIANLERRAKVLIVTLSNNYTLLFHLKMTGQLIFDLRFTINDLRKKLEENQYKYARVIFFFDDDAALVFNDLRKFAYIKLVPQSNVGEMLGKEKFGPEPLSPDFTLEKFREILAKYPKRKIKQLLMDQSVIAGIGNIYSDEICFYAKVNPTKQINNLTNKQIELLFKGIKEILIKAVKLRGTSIDTYVDASGQKGDFVKELKVYDREGEKCILCPGKVKRIKLGGRSSYFCPKCQD